MRLGIVLIQICVLLGWPLMLLAAEGSGMRADVRQGYRCCAREARHSLSEGCCGNACCHGSGPSSSDTELKCGCAPDLQFHISVPMQKVFLEDSWVLSITEPSVTVYLLARVAEFPGFSPQQFRPPLRQPALL